MSERAGDRRLWPRGSQERAVERFYQHGVERYQDYHGGMLNFGLWAEGASTYAQASEGLVEHVARGVGLGAESRLLDVACGMGAQDVFLARRTGCRSIDGLDVTWKHVVAARRRAAASNLQDVVRFHHGSAVALPFEDASFTQVTCIEGGEHFDTREKFLHEAFRVLVPGGQIGMTDYSMKRAPRTLLERSLAELVRRLWHVPRPNVDTAEDFRRKLERAGFAGVRIEEAGARVIPGYTLEGRKPANVAAMKKIRGFWVTHASLWIDTLTHALYTRGMLEYVFVFAEKPNRS